MKQIYRYFTAALLMAGMLSALSSCYKDLSTEADKVIPDIVVGDDGLEGVINVSYGEEFTMTPEVSQEGRNPSDFEYLWEIDLMPGSLKGRLELGTERKLEYKIGNTPSDRPYILTLKITDKQTGLFVIKTWKMYVSSSLGEGILVAHTHDNGVSTELDLVADEKISYGFKGDEARYVRNLYAFANGEAYQGSINSLCPNASSNAGPFNSSSILIAGDQGLVALDPLTYKVSRKNEELFYITPEGGYQNFTDIFNFANYFTGCIMDNRLYSMVCNSGNSFNKLKFTKDPDNTFHKNSIACSKGEQGSICSFDKVHGGVYWIKGWMSGMGGLAELNDKPETFDIAQSDPLAGGSFKNLILGFVVKKNTGGHCLYRLDFNPFEPVTEEFEMTAPEIDDAVSFEFCENCNIFYYATEKSIYANAIVGNSVNTKKVNWSPDSPDEKITDIIHYQQAWYGTHQYADHYDFILPATHQLMMLVVTYNSKTGEGKIYPKFFNVSTGLFTFKTLPSYRGFGKITALTTTFK